MILSKEQIDAMLEAANPLVKFPNENCHPHVKVIVVSRTELKSSKVLLGSKLRNSSRTRERQMNLNLTRSEVRSILENCNHITRMEADAVSIISQRAPSFSARRSKTGGRSSAKLARWVAEETQMSDKPREPHDLSQWDGVISFAVSKLSKSATMRGCVTKT